MGGKLHQNVINRMINQVNDTMQAIAEVNRTLMSDSYKVKKKEKSIITHFLTTYTSTYVLNLSAPIQLNPCSSSNVSV